MNVLGFASLNHDPAVAVLSAGKIVAAIESEKITRAKHEINVFPDAALRAVLQIAKLDLSDVEAIATNYDARFAANRFFLPHLWRMMRARSFDLGAILSTVVIGATHHPRMFAMLT
jgi:predicted NodU family carbamoyl transferase